MFDQTGKYFETSDGEWLETCPDCGGDARENYFDRELCGCGNMHTRCLFCSYPLDLCTLEDDYVPTVPASAFVDRPNLVQQITQRQEASLMDKITEAADSGPSSGSAGCPWWIEIGTTTDDRMPPDTVMITNVFQTKDSGERQSYDSGMVRDTQAGKPRFDLLLADGIAYEDQFLTRFAALMERGAQKYGDQNWTLADSREELNRFRASAIRHMMQWASGERDEDHAAAAAFNLMAYEMTLTKMEG